MSEQPPYCYDAALAGEIEARWQDRWEAEGTFHAADPAGPLSEGFDPRRPKFYILDMFPYPSGAGLHVGHPLGYIATDVYARYLRMTGHNVLHTMGFDAFGLPAEQYAISTGGHPADTTRENIDRYRRQLRRLGLGHDRRREIATTDPSYYRWTQWIFLQIFNSWFDAERGKARPIAELIAEFECGARPIGDGRRWADLPQGERRLLIDGHRLAHISEEPVNWCPALGTVLANEEVTAEGRSDVGNHPVFRRPLRQWMLRITAYSQRLADDLELVGWPERIKVMQRNWIAGLRDWLFSRQRYWGEPFPIVYDEHGPVALPEEMLPVTLPDMPSHSPHPPPSTDSSADPVPPLASAVDWAEVELDLGAGRKPYKRETNTMPQWAGSCWYYLRYLDPTGGEAFVGPAVERYWMPVDLYVGGVEHAVLHLLYARFWHKVLYDLGHLSAPEPFRRLFNQGYILADAFTDDRGMYVPAAEVVHRGGRAFHEGSPVTRRAGKMGKSLRNGISPDEIHAAYGADTLRLYEMAMGPLDADRHWHTDDIAGVHRFLRRLWRHIIDERTGEVRVTDGPMDEEGVRRLHRTILVVREDFDALRFNTAIARLIELNSYAGKIDGGVPRRLADAMVRMVAPLAPHVAEELWARLGHSGSIAYVSFPEGDPALAANPTVTMPVQIDGRTRFTIEVPAGAGEEEIRRIVTAHPECARHTVRRIVVVPGRIANVVTR